MEALLRPLNVEGNSSSNESLYTSSFSVGGGPSDPASFNRSKTNISTDSGYSQPDSSSVLPPNYGYSATTTGTLEFANPPASTFDSSHHNNHQQPYIPPEATSELLALFFQYFTPIMPLVHKRTFYQNLSTQSPLILNSIYALAARWSNHPAIKKSSGAEGDKRYNSGDVFYIRAREMVDHYMDVPNMTTVNALLILATYAAESGRGSAAWMYSGMAIRMAQELKLNIEPDFEESLPPLSGPSSPSTWLEQETRRRLWWTCFIMDRYAGAAADRSMIINEKDCKVYLPATETDWVNGFPSHRNPHPAGPTSPDSYQIAVLTSTAAFTPGIPSPTPYGAFCLLVKIFGKIVDYSNMCKSTQRTSTTPALSPDADYQLSILDASLRDWFAMLPGWMRVVGDEFVPTFDGIGNGVQPWLVAYLHIFYHCCVIVLHRPKMMAALKEREREAETSARSGSGLSPASAGAAALAENPAYIVCLSSACEITTILRKVMRTNPNLFYLSPFVGFCIFQSGLVYLVSLQSTQINGEDGQMRPPGGDINPNTVTRDQAEENIDIHLRALEGIGRYWFMPERLGSMFRSLLDGCRNSTQNRWLEGGGVGYGISGVGALELTPGGTRSAANGMEILQGQMGQTGPVPVYQGDLDRIGRVPGVGRNAKETSIALGGVTDVGMVVSPTAMGISSATSPAGSARAAPGVYPEYDYFPQPNGMAPPIPQASVSQPHVGMPWNTNPGMIPTGGAMDMGAMPGMINPLYGAPQAQAQGFVPPPPVFGYGDGRGNGLGGPYGGRW